MIYLIIVNTVILLLVLYLVKNTISKNNNSKRGYGNSVDLYTTLSEKKLKDDIDLEKDRDLVVIDEYMSYISTVIDRYNNSRNKRVAYMTKKALLGKTVEIVPLFSKYITIEFYYSPDDNAFKGITERDLMKMLESSYNDFTHDNLDSFNSILPIILRLRDTK